MATVADNLKKLEGTAAVSVPMTFELYGGPHARSGFITSRSRAIVTTHASTGAFTTTLAEGVYRVRWRIGTEFNQFFIGVPSGSDTYAFSEIATATPEEITNPTVAYFSDLDALAAAVTHASLIFVGEDGNDDPAWFETGTDNSGMQGVDWVTDSGGVRIWVRTT